MAAFSQQNLTDIREVFDLYDKTGKGSIDHLSVAEVIRCLGYNPTQTDLGKALQNTKLENMTKQFISFDQFCPILSELMKNEANVMDEEFIEGLRVFDRDSSGLISAAELRHALGSLGDGMGNQEIDNLINDFEDTNGQVNYSDFVRRICENNDKPLENRM